MTYYGVKLNSKQLIPSRNNIISGIYLVKNNITQQLYVGQSNDIARRWYEHCKNSRNKFRLDRAIKKYKPDNFSVYVLLVLPEVKELYNKYEKFYIDFFGTYDNNTFHYNMTPGGEGFGFKEDHPNYKGKLIDDVGGIEYLKKSKASGKSLEDMLNELNMNDKAFYNYLKSHGYSGWHDLTGKRESSLGKNHFNCKWQIIDDAGGIDFIKSCKSKGMLKKDIIEDIGTTIFVFDNYLKNHGFKSWRSLN